MGHKALLAQRRECSASVVLRSYPKGDRSCLVPDPDVMVLKPLWCSPPVAGQWDGEHVEGRPCPSSSAGNLCPQLLVEDAERVSPRVRHFPLGPTFSSFRQEMVEDLQHGITRLGRFLSRSKVTSFKAEDRVPHIVSGPETGGSHQLEVLVRVFPVRCRDRAPVSRSRSPTEGSV